MKRNPIPATISYGELVFRPAGYRVPAIGEMYVAKNGHIKKCGILPPAGECLIVREFDAENDFKRKPRR